jgi:hypothetical protein
VGMPGNVVAVLLGTATVRLGAAVTACSDSKVSPGRGSTLSPQDDSAIASNAATAMFKMRACDETDCHPVLISNLHYARRQFA